MEIVEPKILELEEIVGIINRRAKGKPEGDACMSADTEIDSSANISLSAILDDVFDIAADIKVAQQVAQQLVADVRKTFQTKNLSNN